MCSVRVGLSLAAYARSDSLVSRLQLVLDCIVVQRSPVFKLLLEPDHESLTTVVY